MRASFIQRALDFNSWPQACANSGSLPLCQNKNSNSQSLGSTSMANAPLNYSGIHSCNYLGSLSSYFILRISHCIALKYQFGF